MFKTDFPSMWKVNFPGRDSRVRPLTGSLTKAYQERKSGHPEGYFLALQKGFLMEDFKGII
jgi:hypothetical protein